MISSRKPPSNNTKNTSNRSKTKQNINIIKHFEPNKKNQILSDNLPEYNIDNEHIITDKTKIMIKNNKTKLNKNNSNDAKIINDKNPIETKKINYNQHKSLIKNKQNFDNLQLQSMPKCIENERIETNLSNINRNSKIRLSLRQEICKNMEDNNEEYVQTYGYLKKIHNEIRNSRRTLNRNQTDTNGCPNKAIVGGDLQAIDHKNAIHDDYVEKLKNELLLNKTKSTQNRCDLIEKLKSEIHEYRRNLHDKPDKQSTFTTEKSKNNNNADGIASIMPPVKTIVETVDVILQTEDLNTIDGIVGMENCKESCQKCSKNIENQIQEAHNLINQVRDTLQDMKGVLIIKQIETEKKDCRRTTPPRSPTRKPTGNTTNLIDQDRPTAVKLDIIQKQKSENARCENFGNSTIRDVIVIDRASSPIENSPKDQMKSFKDQCNQCDCDRIVPSKIIGEDKCLGTDVIEFDVVEETKSKPIKSLEIVDGTHQTTDKPSKLSIQHLPSIDIRRGLVIQKALQLNIKPTESINTHGEGVTNIGYKEIQLREITEKYNRPTQLEINRIDATTSPFPLYDDKGVQVSDFECEQAPNSNNSSDRTAISQSLIECVKKKYEVAEDLDHLSDDIALILRSYQVSDKNCTFDLSNGTKSPISQLSSSINETFINPNGLTQRPQQQQQNLSSVSKDNTIGDDRISDRTPGELLQKTETTKDGWDIGYHSSQAIQCNLSPNQLIDDDLDNQQIRVKDYSAENQSLVEYLDNNRELPINSICFTKYSTIGTIPDDLGQHVHHPRYELFNFRTQFRADPTVKLLDLSISNSSSTETGEISCSDNELQCKCNNISIGEIHNCKNNHKIDVKSLDIAKQKTVYRNWVSYTLNKKCKTLIDNSQSSSI